MNKIRRIISKYHDVISRRVISFIFIVIVVEVISKRVRPLSENIFERMIIAIISVVIAASVFLIIETLFVKCKNGGR